jgi:anion-transporting  ArsA/GET3 family ATPase
MYHGFAERAERAQGLLRDPRCLIVVVTTSETERIAETRGFLDSLRAIGLKADALIVNRTLPEMPSLSQLAKLKMTPALKRKLRRNWEDFASLKSGEDESMAALRAMMPHGASIIAVSDLGREPSSLSDLAAIARCLTGVAMDGDSATPSD